jgi:hypothetical protein
MTELTRRPAKGPDRGWVVYFGDVRIGHIGIRTGVPVSRVAVGVDLRFLSGLRSRTADQRNR